MVHSWLQWPRQCPPQKAPATATGATASLPNPTQPSPIEPLAAPASCSPLGLFLHQTPPLSPITTLLTRPRFLQKVLLSPSGRWLTSAPAPAPSPPHSAFPDGACPHVLCLDSRFQPICEHPSLPLAPASHACASTDSFGEEGTRGGRQGDKSPKERSRRGRRRGERRFTSAPQHGCSLQAGGLPAE